MESVQINQFGERARNLEGISIGGERVSQWDSLSAPYAGLPTQSIPPSYDPPTCFTRSPTYWTSLACCGVKEVAGLSHMRKGEEGCKEILREIVGNNEINFCAFVLFTEVAKHPRKYGISLKEMIERECLGSVVVATPGINPNSKNLLNVFIWTLDREGIEAWRTKGFTIGKVKLVVRKGMRRAAAILTGGKNECDQVTPAPD